MIRSKTLALTTFRRELGRPWLFRKRLLLPGNPHTAAAASAAASAQQLGSQARGYRGASARHTKHHNSRVRIAGSYCASSDGRRWRTIPSAQSLRCCTSSSTFSGALEATKEERLAGVGGGVHGVGAARHMATSAAAAKKSRKDANGIAFETGKVRKGVSNGVQYGMIVFSSDCLEQSHQNCVINRAVMAHTADSSLWRAIQAFCVAEKVEGREALVPLKCSCITASQHNATGFLRI